MRRPHPISLVPWLILGVIVLSREGGARADGPSAGGGTGRSIDFNHQIRPILAENCLTCHGPDASRRKAGLRLDRGDEATSSDGVIVAGDPSQSELIDRVSTDDADRRMPPPKAGTRLTPQQVELLRAWIAQGAEWSPHWSLIPPRRPAPPAVERADWPRNPIDVFVLARLEAEGLQPSPEADRATLLRRVTLDLTGLPPTPAEADAFLADRRPDAYERVVDRLLASPHYGERMALDWLDAARYADSGGYQGDIFRTMWPWRDWVIAAFNGNMPFDRFTVEQLAGDLLPSPTRAQRIATGLHRNHRINDENGIIPEEFRVEYVADRAETTATVWLGLTLGCARCHDHKYDPLPQEDYYRFFAFFNSITEQGRGHGNAPPVLALTTPEQQAKIAAAEAKVGRLRDERDGLPADEAGQKRREAIAAAIKGLEAQRDGILKSATTVMVMQELETPRGTFVLVRGAYDKPGAKVEPGVPGVLPPLPAGAPANRHGLARWLVDPGHPLTARVAVNRLWQADFGTGLVETAADFGTRGEPPSHPELLDWLATEFLRSGWDVKALRRLIVTSATYRQSSAGTAALYRRDPANRLLARGPRFRLPAELIRDQALAASGLLVPRLGGPPVRPYQPEGLWKELAAVHLDYEQGHGPDLYRRSLYTFWRRTIPPPALSAFDAPNREVCFVRRARTNTPLQALVLMNDPT